MKILSLVLSTIFFLNMGWSQPMLKPSTVVHPKLNSSPLKSSPSSSKTSTVATAKASTVTEDQVMSSTAVSLRLQQEERIKDFVKIWNQSSNFSKAIEQFAVSKEDQFFLQQVL